MSASLVGSEMCIRDRASLATKRDIKNSVTAFIIACRVSSSLAGMQGISCLLYTSDAADDM
eukprot:13617643-Alexandrium_andersonii.AAC.1